jgi:hypothetical protein
MIIDLAADARPELLVADRGLGAQCLSEAHALALVTTIRSVTVYSIITGRVTVPALALTRVADIVGAGIPVVAVARVLADLELTQPLHAEPGKSYIRACRIRRLAMTRCDLFRRPTGIVALRTYQSRRTAHPALAFDGARAGTRAGKYGRARHEHEKRKL